MANFKSLGRKLKSLLAVDVSLTTIFDQLHANVTAEVEPKFGTSALFNFFFVLNGILAKSIIIQVYLSSREADAETVNACSSALRCR
jgi:hypothetical protein